MQSFDFLISWITIICFTLLIGSILHDAKIDMEILEITDQKFSDFCNILYITDFGIETKETEVVNDWCLSPSKNFEYIWSWS